MIAVQIEFKREHDGSVIVHYTRSNGTQTWERQKGGRAVYFPAHDILHYCVETVLKLRCGFYGLIAQGWHICEMDGKHDRGRLPADSILVEQLVGLFSTERVNGSPIAGEEINAQMEVYAKQAGNCPTSPFLRRGTGWGAFLDRPIDGQMDCVANRGKPSSQLPTLNCLVGVGRTAREADSA